ncbi:unnamed protein product [Euphydryas editha]|uniref:Uncharacterized protein n=1 Tax=Euphydryas editha TaxID=104508 RepID=A0AAU9TJ00_EUPED|nr:unnamed protein product [Euphydryas editha]
MIRIHEKAQLQVKKVLKNSTLGEKFKKQLKLLDEGSSDGNLDVDGTESSKVSKNDAEPSRTSSNLKRSHIGKGKSSKKITSNADHHKSITESEAQLALIPPSPLDKNSSHLKTDRSTSKKGKKSRKTKEKELSYDAILKFLNKISDDVDWLKKHHTGLESFIIENLTANLENWNQVKPVGYVRVDTNMIHLGQNVWLPKQSIIIDAVYNAATNSMFVKNIAMAVFGSQYLKEHSVKGKSCNKTKSKPRPAIDPTKALAVRVPKVPPKPKESSSSSYESSVGSDDEKNAEEETQKEDAAEESSVE